MARDNQSTSRSHQALSNELFMLMCRAHPRILTRAPSGDNIIPAVIRVSPVFKLSCPLTQARNFIHNHVSTTSQRICTLNWKCKLITLSTTNKA